MIDDSNSWNFSGKHIMRKMLSGLIVNSDQSSMSPISNCKRSIVQSCTNQKKLLSTRRPISGRPHKQKSAREKFKLSSPYGFRLVAILLSWPPYQPNVVSTRVSSVPNSDPSIMPPTPSSLRMEVRRALSSPEPTIPPSNYPTITAKNYQSFDPTIILSSSPTFIQNTLSSNNPTSNLTPIPSGNLNSDPSIAKNLNVTTDVSVTRNNLTSYPSTISSISNAPSDHPTSATTIAPSNHVSSYPTITSSKYPTSYPTSEPTITPSNAFTSDPSSIPSNHPTSYSTFEPTIAPKDYVSSDRTSLPSNYPSISPSSYLTSLPTSYKTAPTSKPSISRIRHLTSDPTVFPSNYSTLYSTFEPPIAPRNDDASHRTKIPHIYRSPYPNTFRSKHPPSLPTSLSNAPSSIERPPARNYNLEAEMTLSNCDELDHSSIKEWQDTTSNFIIQRILRNYGKSQYLINVSVVTQINLQIKQKDYSSLQKSRKYMRQNVPDGKISALLIKFGIHLTFRSIIDYHNAQAYVEDSFNTTRDQQSYIWSFDCSDNPAFENLVSATVKSQLSNRPFPSPEGSESENSNTIVLTAFAIISSALILGLIIIFICRCNIHIACVKRRGAASNMRGTRQTGNGYKAQYIGTRADSRRDDTNSFGYLRTRATKASKIDCPINESDSSSNYYSSSDSDTIEDTNDNIKGAVVKESIKEFQPKPLSREINPTVIAQVSSKNSVSLSPSFKEKTKVFQPKPLCREINPTIAIAEVSSKKSVSQSPSSPPKSSILQPALSNLEGRYTTFPQKSTIAPKASSSPSSSSKTNSSILHSLSSKSESTNTSSTLTHALAPTASNLTEGDVAIDSEADKLIRELVDNESDNDKVAQKAHFCLDKYTQDSIRLSDKDGSYKKRQSEVRPTMQVDNSFGVYGKGQRSFLKNATDVLYSNKASEMSVPLQREDISVAKTSTSSTTMFKDGKDIFSCFEEKGPPFQMSFGRAIPHKGGTSDSIRLDSMDIRSQSQSAASQNEHYSVDSKELSPGPFTCASPSQVSLFSDDSSNELYKGKAKVLELTAPPGWLGIVIVTSEGGIPTVHSIKNDSVLSDKVQPGDKLISVNSVDTTELSAKKVSELVTSFKDKRRTFVFIRQT